MCFELELEMAVFQGLQLIQFHTVEEDEQMYYFDQHFFWKKKTTLTFTLMSVKEESFKVMMF